MFRGLKQSRVKQIRLGVIFVVFNVLPLSLSASSSEEEIEFLLSAVGDSGCMFIRNGSHHDSKDAESHLRLKYRNGKSYVNSAESFIKRLATKSSWTSKPYTIKCSGKEAEPSAKWLGDTLAQYRGVAET
jgi:hypothetical protein